jgi:hypothetical protein
MDRNTIQLPREFKEFIELLNAEKVEYLLVGAWALALHGCPRYTADMDIWIRPSSDNAQAIIRALRQFGFRSRPFTPEQFTDERKIFRFGLPPTQVDLVMAIAGVDFSSAWEHREIVELEGVPVNVINRECFVKNKQAAGRLQDLADVEAITRIGQVNPSE